MFGCTRHKSSVRCKYSPEVDLRGHPFECPQEFKERIWKGESPRSQGARMVEVP